MDLTSQYSAIISLVIFIIFLILGYLSLKRSGGFFLILAGFSLIGTAVTAYEALTYIASVLVLFGCFIILSGGLKAFYNKTPQAETGGPIRGS
jgi:hypothetical protein